MSNQTTLEKKVLETEPEFSFNKVLKGRFNDVYEHVIKIFAEKGFGVVSEINLHEKFKAKLQVDINTYKILGICSPSFAYEAMQIEENIGIFLPCKVLLKEIDKNSVEVIVLNPEKIMQVLNNPKLNKLAKEVTQILHAATTKL